MNVRQGKVDTKKVWWVQAEAILVLLTDTRRIPPGQNTSLRRERYGIILKYMIDHREGSEWFNELKKDGQPIKSKEIVGP